MKKSRAKVIQVILLLILTISAGILLYDMVIVPKQNQKMTKQLKDAFPKKDTVFTGDPSPAKKPGTKAKTSPAGEEHQERQLTSLDFSNLQKSYPDIKGWITIPDSDVDYPVLQSQEEEPEYYLKRNYRKEADANGSLFLQWNCDVFESKNLVIYGHNMNSGAMFGSLERYTDPTYCRMYPDIFFQSKNEMEVYQIAAVLKVDTSMFPFQQVTFQEPDSLEAYVKQAKAQSLFETGNGTTAVTKVLTLVTCSYEWEEARVVIVATKS